MYEAWDMLSGRLYTRNWGVSAEVLHIIGVNFYDRNEWTNCGTTLPRSDPRYRPFHAILLEVWKRYSVPIVVSETGTEDAKRPGLISLYLGRSAARGWARRAHGRHLPLSNSQSSRMGRRSALLQRSV